MDTGKINVSPIARLLNRGSEGSKVVAPYCSILPFILGVADAVGRDRIFASPPDPCTHGTHIQ